MIFFRVASHVNRSQTVSRLARTVALSLITLVSPLGCFGPQVSANEEIDASMATLEWLDLHYGVVQNRDLNRLLQKISSRLSNSMRGQALEPPFTLGNDSLPARETLGYADYPWQVLVIRNPAPNAFSLGAGAIVLTDGMIRETRTEAELASVIAHEMAHQLLGHTRHALEASLEAEGSPHAVFSLEDEIAADRLGLKLLDVGRYNLNHAISALSIAYRSLDKNSSSQPKEWLALRMANLHQALQDYEGHFPGTETTREFGKVRRTL